MSPLTTPWMKPLALAVLTALVAIAAAAVTGTGRATPPAGNGLIAFQR